MRSLIGTSLLLASAAFFVVAGCTVKNEASATICQPKQKTRCNDCTKTDPSDPNVWRGWTTCADDGKSFIGGCTECAPDTGSTGTNPGSNGNPSSNPITSNDAGGDGVGPMSPNPTKPSPANAVQSCTDFGGVVAYNAQRCGGNAEAARTGFIQSAADGDCKNIVAIRDVDALYATCFPALDGSSCDDITSGNLDDSCLGQLEETVTPAGDGGN